MWQVGLRSALAVVLGLLLWGCGEGEAEDEGSSAASEPLRELARLADDESAELANARWTEAADFVAARAQAGLPADADLFATADPVAGPDSAAIGRLTRELLGFPFSPFGETAELMALDGSKIEAAAATVPIFGEPGTLLIRTSQAYGEVKAELLEAGMEEDQEVLEGSRARGEPSYFRYITETGENLILLSDSRKVAEAASGAGAASGNGSATGQSGGGTAARATDRIDASHPFATAIAAQSRCVDVALARQGVAPLGGEILLSGAIAPSDVEVVESFEKANEVLGPRSQSGRIEIAFEPRAEEAAFHGVAFTELLDKGAAVRYGC